MAKAPSINDYKDALNADLFLYLGHGSGKEFLKGEAVFTIQLDLSCFSLRLRKLCEDLETFLQVSSII